MRALMLTALLLTACATETRSARAWSRIELQASAFYTTYWRWPRDIRELDAFARSRGESLHLEEFVWIRLRHKGEDHSIEGETQPPESNSEGRRLIVLY